MSMNSDQHSWWSKHGIALWGVVSVSLLLIQALMRLTPHAFNAWQPGLMNPWHIALYLAWTLLNAYTEGYRAFQQRFCPRVLERAYELQNNPRPLWVALALVYCMELAWAPRKRMLRAWILVLMIVLIVVVVRQLAQPWRGIIDAGVVAGLSWGLLALWWQFGQGLLRSKVQTEYI